MYASDYFETKILNLARGQSITAPSTVYLALFLNDPTDAGTGTEVSYSGYARKAIVFTAPTVDGSGMSMSNNAQITFATSNASIGSATYVGIYDSLTGGNLLLYGQLTEPIAINAGVAPVVRVNSAKWTFSGKLSNAYKTNVMNTLRGINCSGFTPYLALCNGSTEAGGQEFSGNSYARVAMVFGAPVDDGGPMKISNTAQVETPVATGTWGQLTHIALYDAATAGNPYLIDSSSVSILMNTGKSVIYKIGDFNFSIA